MNTIALKCIANILILFLIWSNTLQAQKISGFTASQNQVILAWNQLFFKLCLKNDGYRVTVATRVLAYSNWAAYEAITPVMKNHKSILKFRFETQFPNSKKIQPIVAANYAYYLSFLHFFPKIDTNQRKTIDSLNSYFDNKLLTENHEKDIQLSKYWAKTVVDSIIKKANIDGGANAYLQNKPLDYADKMPKGEGLWQRTYPDYLYALTPYWGDVKTILIHKDSIHFIPPIQYSIDTNSLFFKQAKEVYLLAQNSDKEQLTISQFWSDDIQFFTPDIASHFISIACQLIEKKQLGLEESSHLITKLAIGLFDGSIICWKEKYLFNVLRPITYIRNNIDAQWRTNLNDDFKGGIKNRGITPAHPSYPSGHSVFGAIAQIVFEDTFKETFSFTDYTYANRNDLGRIIRSYESFESMALENAYSRLNLGVHFRMDCDEGLRIGYQIGNQLNKIKL
jgi:hypothetical protein